jgi:cytochrome c-type protein NapC
MFNWVKRLAVALGNLLGKLPGGPLAVMVLGLFVGALFVVGFTSSLVYTSTEKFCSTTCHEMTDNVAMEYKDSVHDSNRTGVRAVCPDCHVPKSVIPLYFRKMGALHDLWSHLVSHEVGTREKFLAKRYQLAKRVWVYMKFNDSRECRGCHNADKMSPDRQSPEAQIRHAKGKKDGFTCIDCHYAISHNEPEGPGPQEIKVEKEWSWMSLI